MAKSKHGRFLTRWYIATTEDEAERMAALDHTPLDEIKKTYKVKPLCVSVKFGNWSYWSDGIWIDGHTFVGEKPTNCVIAKSVCDFISNAAGSDSGIPSKRILNILVKAKGITEGIEHPVAKGRGSYARARIEEYDVDMGEKKQIKLFVATVGYSEGYLFEVERTLEDAMRYFR